MNWVAVGLAGWLVLQVGLGLVISRQVASSADYLVAGRKLGLVLCSVSLFATWFGAETCVGVAGNVYREGIIGALAEPLAYSVALAVAGLIYAGSLWRGGYTTLGDLFRKRYGQGVERLAVLLLVPSSVMWAAAQVRAFGAIVGHVLSVDATIAVPVATVVILTYISTGGLLADVWTDLLQGGVLLVTLMILTVAILGEAPEGALMGRLSEPVAWPSGLEIVEAWALPIGGSLLAQEVVARLLAARSPEIARQSAVLGAVVYAFAGMMPVVIGLVGPSLVPNLDDPEALVAVLAERHFGVWLQIVFQGALLSAILSTADSALLAAGGLVAKNIVQPLVPGLSDGALLRTSRGMVVGAGVIAGGFALTGESVFSLVQEGTALGSAGIAVAGTFGLFSRLGGPWAAAASLLTGTIGYAALSQGELTVAPYLAALGLALVAFVGVAAVEGRRG